MATQKKFVVLGAGFWTRFQLAAWQTIPEAKCVAIANRTVAKAEEMAREFSIDHVYSDSLEAIRHAGIDFVDIISSNPSHYPLTKACLELGIPVMCQKPLAENLSDAEELLSLSSRLNVPLLVHENWRWQKPFRVLKDLLAENPIGEVYRARLDMVSGFPVFKNQPSLAELDRFLLNDIGVHVLDAARFLFGDAQSVYCQLRKVQAEIQGEDAGTMQTKHSDVMVTINLSYVQNHYADECFPQTIGLIEGAKGSIKILPGYKILVSNSRGTVEYDAKPERYAWADPAYDVVHASIVPCLQDLFGHIQGTGTAETTAADNLKTLRGIEAAYQSAASNSVISLG